jgi:anti-sigma regulatory factor (Ser/Thr protein kinase)
VTAPLEEREVGGLGVMLVKQLMDDVRYARLDGKNVLTIRKRA